MKNHINHEQLFTEVIFENRNKNYGAYVLRSEADRILTKSLFIGVSLLAAVSLAPLAVNIFKADKVIGHTDGGHILISVPDLTEVVKPVTPVKPEAAAPPVKTIDRTVPMPTANVQNEVKPIKIEGAIAGTVNSNIGETAPPNTYIPVTAPTVQTGPPATTQTVETVKPVDPNAIPVKVDVEANFPGGLDAFRNKVISNFDGSGIETDDVMKTTVTFIVERDGSISNLKANGKLLEFNNEAIRTVKSIKGKWIPAKINNQAVRSYFTLPITMKFDN
ncbi:hypothetical protein ASG01_09815 [Chryseobacterium sp. Leaf180]|uniref:energy transducer TonB n=1 Tax=Chryseobacterium sp. Leaf180 TaxID=1736289 RepID=UPI000701AABA|nr:hypothetical protein [Chryseobacterium sp. Leaf180]KQR93468.1 hypothetical protein ASG01_09815 [Chryseobacterium sp. Leaf180]